VLAIVGACLAVLTACTSSNQPGASGSGTPSGTAGGTPGASTSAANSEACQLLTQQEIAAAAGRPVGAPEVHTLAGASVCQYTDVAVTKLQSPVTAAQFDATVRQIASTGQVQAVDGIGDAAAYIPLLRELCAVRTSTFFCIAGLDRAASETLARKAVERV
jgi:hypothetical protein